MGWKGLEEDEMENQYDEALFWEPDIDDVLQGTVKRIKKGKYNTFMVIKDDEGEHWTTPQHAQLVRQIERLEIVEGDVVHITFKGEGEPPEDPGYSAPKLYKLLKWEEE